MGSLVDFIMHNQICYFADSDGNVFVENCIPTISIKPVFLDSNNREYDQRENTCDSEELDKFLNEFSIVDRVGETI